MTRTLVCLTALATLAACSPDEVVDPAPKGVVQGVYGPLGTVRPDVTEAQKAAFERGRDVALRRFTPDEGFGPRFNTSFCAGCHEKPAFGGSAPRYRNFLLVRQELSDGSQTALGKEGVQHQYSLDPESYIPLDAETNVIATRNPIPFFGLGLIAEIDELAVLANADPDDLDGDGISGRPNYDRGFVGRFGRKAQTVSIEGFIRGPLANHLGITSDPLPNARKAQLPVPSAVDLNTLGTRTDGLVGQVKQAQAAAPDEPTTDDDGIPDPELAEDDLFDLISFSMLLAAPEPLPVEGIAVEGQALFGELQCASCHVPALEGPRGLVPAYSDLLLHDMGEALADGVKMGLAEGSEFRTQPLWGIAAVGPYLHDGRADTIDDAIRMHGGEAQNAADGYAALDADAQAALLAFLDTLGGADQRSDGLLPPDAAVPAVGEYGGPSSALSPEEAERFARGRARFDRDQLLGEGLGEQFNGDSCRACHFDPVSGGAGSPDVNVIRHGMIQNDQFVAPDQGTIVFRHAADGSVRPAFDPAANVFEPRQTPALFGIGLIDRIPEADILALEDPEDADGDGISGRAHILPDGRLGRLGWKADVPSLAEFARDATSTELGVSLPDQPGLTFGVATDGDAVADPEIEMGALEDLLFYMANLAPPPREGQAAEGETLFAQVGCGSCHRSDLTTADGVPVAMYSDLLLHDVAPNGFVGVGSGDATMREFRTAPLWGIGRTAPYMHDGRAYSLEAAIAAHAGEATSAVTAYEGLSGAEREALLSFLRSL